MASLRFIITLYQASPRTGERRPDGADRQTGLRGDVRITQTRVPQQQNIPVAFAQSFQRPADGPLPLSLLQLFSGILDRPGRLALDQREVLPASNRGPRLIPRQVSSDGEEKCPRVLRIMLQGA